MIFFIFRIFLLLFGLLVLFSFLRNLYQQKVGKTEGKSEEKEQEEDYWDEF